MAKTLHQEGQLSGSPGQPEAGQAGGQGVTITAAAAKEIQRQRTKRGTPDGIIRIGIRGGGCSGFSYLFDWADGAPREGDQVFSEHGVTIYVDKKSMKFLQGMVLDHTSGMMGHGFKFNNPNAKGSCGCGESVQF